MADESTTPDEMPKSVVTGEPLTVEQLFKEIDTDREAGVVRPPAPPVRPVQFRRLKRLEPTDPTPGTAPGSGGAGTATHGGSIPSSASAPTDYQSWLRAMHDKYAGLLRVRSSPDFIDISLMNTVMADFGGTFCEVAREAREYQDHAEDAKERFDLWWDGKVDEARALAVTQSKKFTSDSGLQAFARSSFAEEYQRRHEPVKEAQRKAEFVGTLKMIVSNMPTVFRALGPSTAFEWSTAGGLKFDGGDGNTYFGLPARRIGQQPPPHALMEASRRRSGAAPTAG